MPHLIDATSLDGPLTLESPMKQKIADLEGKQLDAAVHLALHGQPATWTVPQQLVGTMREKASPPLLPYSTEWAFSGPIIEREHIELQCHHHLSDIYAGQWFARAGDKPSGSLSGEYGPTPLVAAMRAFVASKLGDEVDL